MGYPRFQLARNFKTARRTSGNITYALATWGNFDTALDLVLTGQVGDSIEVGANGFVSNEAVNGNLDVATIVSASVVNTFSAQGVEAINDGIMSWLGIASVLSKISGGALYTLQSGDLSGGAVSLRLRVKCATAVTKTWSATTTQPFQWWAKNLGPVDPN